ncbi:hypothetical protein [Bacillus alkalicellulosilyticus]|uniref:hypothetical protein n=1 Tax=Alkalihalobacterium alkalicellulosilyticum TaxID=1912214 RepID=UPI000996F481|nr:hypothetical protein [Bacillus alkalicellulosilyticus]
MLTNHQQTKSLIDKYLLQLKSATTPNEVYYYEQKIYELTEQIAPQPAFNMTTTEKETFQSLKNKMLSATHPKEVEYYERKIHKLLDELEKNPN